MKQFAMALGCVVFAATAAAQETAIAWKVADMKVPLEATTLKGAPYSAETVNDHVQVLGDGNRIVSHSTGRVYRDAEGRTRREEDRPSGSPGISITDPVAGVSYSLDPETRTAWRTPSLAGSVIVNKLTDATRFEGTLTVDAARVDAARIEALKVAEAAAAHAGGNTGQAVTLEVNGGRVSVSRRNAFETRNAEQLPAKMIEGVIADGKRTTTTIAAGSIGNDQAIVITNEEWTSPELQVLVLTERKDPREGTSTYRLVNVSRNEPAASLFQVPADYTIKDTGIRHFERFFQP